MPAHAAAAAVAKPLFGEIAVTRGLVSREHVDLCLRVQAALRARPTSHHKRIGEILHEKGLLTRDEIETVLRVQSGQSMRKPVIVTVPRQAPAREDERQGGRTATPAGPSWLAATLGRVRPKHVVIAAAIPVVAIAVVKVWPAPAAQRALMAYLESCREGSVQPDESLAVADLGLTVRTFRVNELLPAVRHDYAPEINTNLSRLGKDNWADLLASVEMSDDKRRVLSLIASLIPASLTPTQIRSLAVDVQPIRCSLVYKPKGHPLFKSGACDFLMVRVKTPRWTSRWSVASYRPVGPAADGPAE